MTGYAFDFAGERLTALASGALWWARARLLCVSDLHFGKSNRIARRGGAMLPPYETRETLTRLQQDIQTSAANTIVCLGDSFDDLTAASSLSNAETTWINQLTAGRQWIWIEGNHDPGPSAFNGSHLACFKKAALTFRHIADIGDQYEISGHYHPKARVSLRGHRLSKPAFLIDTQRIIMPAYGTYTGGLRCTEPVLADMMQPGAIAVLTGSAARPIPMPRV